MFEKFDIGVFECHAEIELNVNDECQALERIKPPESVIESWEFSESLKEGEKHGIRRDCMRVAMPGYAAWRAHRPAPARVVLPEAVRSREMSHSRKASAR